MKIKIGFGYDVHCLVEKRQLILGGVEIPFEKGLVGHSDGDVLTHAIIDALLGALGEKDIGQLFPDTDPHYKGISSLMLLDEVRKIKRTREAQILSLDSVIIAEKPKITPYLGLIKERLAPFLELSPELVGVKAKTQEGIGEIGQGLAMASYAVIILEKR